MTEPARTATAPNGWTWELLRGFRAGDRWALAEIYRLHAREVATMLSAGFAFQVGERWHNFVGYRSPFDLQDALHETFRLAFEPTARTGYDGVRLYGPYLRTIGRNVVLKAFRLRESLFPLATGGDATEPAGPDAWPQDAPGPEERLARAQLDGLVRRFLETQSPLDRQILELRFVEDLSQRDVADRLKLGRQRIRTRELHLRQRFLEYLRQHDVGPALAGAATALVLLATLLFLLGQVGGP